MPCAAGELCFLQDRTPEAPDGHACRGGCGGRLHGTCGDQEEGESEIHRVCPACTAAKAGAGNGSKAGKGKRKAPDTNGGGAASKQAKPAKKMPDMTGSRKRLTQAQKMEVIGLLDQGVTQNTISERFDCGE